MKAKTLFQRSIAALMAMLMAMPVKAAEVVTYFHNDVSGSPMMATDASGAVLWKETYKPYGDKVNRQPASAANKIGFHGKPFDDNSGLSYMSARYYDPVIGRFTGIDPVSYSVESIHSFNRYAYANNNPYKYVDPDGRWAFLAFLPEILIALGIVGTAASISSDKSAGGDNRTDAEKDAGKPPPSPRSGSADKGGADSKEGSNVRENNSKGKKAEGEVASDLKGEGRQTDRQVRKDTPFGPRVIDIEVKDKDGNVLGGVEVKSGNSRYRQDQRSKDEWLRQNGYPVDVVRKP